MVGGSGGGARGEGGGDCLRVGGGPSGVLGVGSVGMGYHSVFSSYSWCMFRVATDLMFSCHLCVLYSVCFHSTTCCHWLPLPGSAHQDLSSLSCVAFCVAAPGVSSCS